MKNLSTLSNLVLYSALFLFSNDISSQSVTLINFGAAPQENIYELPGWNTTLLSSNMVYTPEGNGVVITGEADELSDFRGVSGSARKFNPGERVVVTWYNNSDDVFYFTARISFTDSDQPEEENYEGKWYTMRSSVDYRQTFAEIQPHSTSSTSFEITDKGVHKTDSSYSLVNINLAIQWGETYQKNLIVCDKIELKNDADITPPLKPAGLTASVLSDSKILLDWNDPLYNPDAVEYLVYLGNEIEGYSSKSNYTACFLEPEKEYSFTVTDLDMSGNESEHSDPVTLSTGSYNHGNALINPTGFEYLGAIILPEEFSWGGEAITYNPIGDGGQEGEGSADGHPGSFFIMNLNQPENGLVAEISIPAPVISENKNPGELNSAAIIQASTNIRPDNINNLEFVDIWRTGLKYIAEENRLYSTWNIYYTVTEGKHVTISCCDVSNLSASTKYGGWYVGGRNESPGDAALSDYLFAVPEPWAQLHTNGRRLITGRYREGGLSGLGPTMYAFSFAGTTPPSPETEFDITTLLEYGSFYESNEYNYPNSIDGYKHSDLWRDADWISVDNQNAVCLIGNKATGNHWYGYYGEHMRHDWVIADIPYPEFWETDPDGKGWRSHNIIPMAIFYNPADLAASADGSIDSFAPQPYTAIRFNRNIFWSKRNEIFSACYDEYNNILYITEFIYEMEGRLIVHAFKVNYVESPISVEYLNTTPVNYALQNNYPNPFNPITNIKYQIPDATHVNMTIYDILGKQVEVIVDEIQKPGHYKVKFDGSRYVSGVYICSFKAGDFSSNKKIILLK